MWWYFFSKAIELMDTVLMVLRKRNRQITFLHVFHHATMLNIWWWVTTFIPGGLCKYCALINKNKNYINHGLLPSTVQGIYLFLSWRNTATTSRHQHHRYYVGIRGRVLSIKSPAFYRRATVPSHRISSSLYCMLFSEELHARYSSNKYGI